LDPKLYSKTLQDEFDWQFVDHIYGVDVAGIAAFCRGRYSESRRPCTFPDKKGLGAMALSTLDKVVAAAGNGGAPSIYITHELAAAFHGATVEAERLYDDPCAAVYATAAKTRFALERYGAAFEPRLNNWKSFLEQTMQGAICMRRDCASIDAHARYLGRSTPGGAPSITNRKGAAVVGDHASRRLLQIKAVPIEGKQSLVY
jgi:hypothetical protein